MHEQLLLVAAAHLKALRVNASHDQQVILIPAQAAAKRAAEQAAIAILEAKEELKKVLEGDGRPTIDTFRAAGFTGITGENAERVSEKILALPVELRSNPAAIEKMVTVVTFFDPQSSPTIDDFKEKGIKTVTEKLVS